MKKFFIKFLVIGIVFLAIWGKNNYKSTKNSMISLGETGISLKLPSKYGLKARTSKINDYFGESTNREWAIIVNHEEKDIYADIDEYAQTSAVANKAGKAKIESDGNYYFEYKNGEYHFYTAVRQNEKYYYRIAFYCYEEEWSEYQDDFEEMATTIRLEENNN